tara:strand:- start:5261 stop:7903 length:2643 start_codon:yes stop_codon:yes gene_type:complete
MQSLDSFSSLKSFNVNNSEYNYFSLKNFFEDFNINIDSVPYCLKILIENILRNENPKYMSKANIKNAFHKFTEKNNGFEIFYYPSRVLMQDFTGVPALTDLVAMRNILNKKGYDANLINPTIPVDLVIDHSVTVDSYGNENSFKSNVEKEFERNIERYEFLKWSQSSFNNFNVVPPGTGICHQVNLEYLAKTIWTKKINNKNYVYPDSVIGTDSHTTMINALSVLGWGVGGIEAEAVMLGEPISMNFPKVVGVNISGKLKEGITATDLVLTITQELRKKGVVGKFVEFYGEGLKNITLADRATISNMSPEYGATCGFFPVDEETLNYFSITGRTEHHINLVKKYSQLQGLWRNNNVHPNYNDTINIDLGSIETCLAGPKRPQDKIIINNVSKEFKELYSVSNNNNYNKLQDGSIVIAAITSCTNTSNPNVLIAAGLVAQKAKEKGLKSKNWVKTSFAPGSKVVSEYLKKSGLDKALNFQGFNVVGYGCTTCIGNSGPLDPNISTKISENNLTVCSILSGNRNFEGRVHPEVKANFLASPPLVIIYALTGNINIDITTEAIGKDKDNKNVYLKDLWPSNNEIQEIINKTLKKEIFIDKYKNIDRGDQNWQKIKLKRQSVFQMNESSTYVKLPPFFSETKNNKSNNDINNARILVMLGDSVTTDHISPAGVIAKDSPAANYLSERQVLLKDFNSYGSRRGNYEIMKRGTFSNIRLKNELVEGIEGGITKYIANGEKLSIYDAAMKYMENSVPLIIIAGKDYGSGSSRDWAAKGVKLLGVKAVIAESFERIHRSNLIGMGVLPLEFISKQNRKSLNISGDEKFSITVGDNLLPRKLLNCKIIKNGKPSNIKLLSRIDTNQELEYFKAGGILQFVLNNIINKIK